jgi:hypothetical protein
VTLDLRITPGYMPRLHPDARMAEETVPGYEDSLWLGIYHPCMVCRQNTTWVELNFNGPLCPSECTNKMWQEYHEANAQNPWAW